jgi:hypothetical protein
MKSISNAPKAPGQIPIENKVFREFGGINTQAARTSIAPEQFSWLENVMPIGAGNLKAVPQKNAALTTLTGKTVYYSKEFNIAGVFYMFYACTDGALFQVRVSDGAQTVIIAAGTYSVSGTQIAQWKNERILIIDFGSQVTQLIARRVREIGVYSEVQPFNKVTAATIKAWSLDPQVAGKSLFDALVQLCVARSNLSGYPGQVFWSHQHLQTEALRGLLPRAVWQVVLVQ